MCVDWRKDFKEISETAVLVDSGYISPTMFKNTFSFDSNVELLDGEKEFADAINNTLNGGTSFVDRINSNYDGLLSKYEVNHAIRKYLH